MKAVTFQGMGAVDVAQVQEPTIQKADDIIVRVTTTGICGSDLHLYHGMIPNLPKGYVIGHEPMGIVEEVGKDVQRVRKGDRVVIPFNVSCGECFYCQHQMESQCDRSNPNGEVGAYFGYSDTFGGYPGGQAEYLRVPYGNFLPFRLPDDCEREDEDFVFLSDILPTAYWGVEQGGVQQGDTVVVLGCGPVGLLAQKFAWMKGAKRVIAVDEVDYRLALARQINQVETVDFGRIERAGDHIKEMTKGGADVVIDCVGMDGKKTLVESVETLLKLQGGAMGPIVLASQCVRKFGIVVFIGVYGMRYNAFPFGDFFARNITMKMGQASVVHLMPHIYQMIVADQIDPTEIITHRLPISDAEHAYRIFDRKEEGCVKVVLKPGKA